MNISPKSPNQSLSYCSIDIGEDCRTAQADFDELFSAPASTTETLKVGDIIYLLTEVRTDRDSSLFGHPAPTPPLVCVQAEGIADVSAKAVPLAPSTVRKTLVSLKLFRVEKSLYELTSSVKLPKEVAKDYLERHRGTDVQYGDYIQLRHMHSGKFLRFSTVPTQTLGSHRVEVGPRSGNLSIIQIRGTEKQGQAVHLHSDVELAVRCEFIDYFLSVQARQSFPHEEFELQACTQHFSWKIGKFSGYAGKKTEVLLNSPFMLRHKALCLNFTVIGGDHDDEPNSAISTPARYSGPQIPILMNKRCDPQCLWMLESTCVFRGGPVESGAQYYLRHVYSMKYLTSSLSMSNDPVDAFAVRLLSGSDTKLASGSCVDVEDSFGRKLEAQVPRLKLGARCIIPAAAKKPSQKERAEVLFASSGGSHAEFEVVQEKAVATFAVWATGFMPVLQRYLKLVEASFHPGEEEEAAREIEADAAIIHHAIKEITDAISGTCGMSEEVSKKQGLGIGFKLHSVLVHIAQGLVRRLRHRARRGSITGQMMLIRGEDESVFARISRTLKRLLPDSLSLLNTLAKDNKPACKALSCLVVEISELFPFSTHAVGSLLSEIYRTFNPASPARYYHPLCAKLVTVTSDNVEEQTLYLSLIRDLSEEDCVIRANSAAELYSVFVDPKKPNFFFKLLLKDSVPHVEILPLRDEMPPSTLLQKNPSLYQLAVESGEGLECSLLALTAQISYVEYVSEGILFMNTLCSRADPAVESMRLSFGFSASTVFSIVKDDRLHLSLRSAALTLLATIVLDLQQLPFTTRKSNLSFCLDEVMGRAERADQLYTKSAQSDLAALVQWCLDFWSRNDAAEHLFTCGPLATLEHLLAVLSVTHSLVNFEYVTHFFGQAVNSAILDLLITLFSSHTEFRAESPWIEQVSHVLPSSNSSSDSPKNFALIYCLRAVQDMTLRLVRLNLDRSQRAKLEQLLRIHYHHRYEPWTPAKSEAIASEVRSVVLGHGLTAELTQVLRLNTSEAVLEQQGRLGMMVREPRIKEFLCSATLSDLELDASTRQELLMLLYEMLEANDGLVRMLKGVDLIEEKDLLDRMEFLNGFSHTFSFFKHGKAIRERLKRDAAERTRLQDSLEQLLSVFSLKGAKPILAKKMQNLARSYRIHYELAALVKQLAGIPGKQSQVLLGLVAAALMNFCYGNITNRVELLGRVSSRFFCLTAPQLPYVIQEISNFEHMTHAEAERSIAFILERSLQPHEDLLSGLHWIHALLSYRAGGYKRDMQTLACFRILSFLQQTRFSLSADTPEAGELVLLLANCAHENSVAIKHCRQLVTAAEIATALGCAKSPLTVRAWVCFLYDVYYSDGTAHVSQALLGRVLESLLPWVDQVLPTLSQFERLVASGAYAQIWSETRPYHVPHLAGYSREAQLWEMLSYGEPWQRNTGLLAILSQLVCRVLNPSEPLLQIYREIYEKLLQIYTEVLEKAGEGIDAGWFMRVLQTCMNTLSQTFSDSKPPAKVESEHQKSMSDASTVLAEESLNSKTNSLIAAEFRSFLLLTIDTIGSLTLDYRVVLKDMAVATYPMGVLAQKHVLSTQRKDLVGMLKLLNGKIGTDLKFVVFDLLTAVIRDIPDKPAVSSVFIESGLVNSALSGVAEQPSLRLMKSSVAFLNALLSKQSAEFLGWFLEEIKTSGAYLTLFMQLKAELECSLDRIMLRSKQTEAEPHLTASERDLFANLLQSGTPLTDVFALAKEYSCHLVRFTQLCCDNCNLAFQQFMSTQEVALGSVDVVDSVSKYIVVLAQYEELLSTVEEARAMVVVSMEALLDFVTGPCVLNQNKLGTDVQLLLAVNKIVRVAASQRDNPDWVAIYCTTLNFVMTLFEGFPSRGVLDSLLQYLDLGFLIEEMHDIYTRYIKGRERALLLESPTIPPIAHVSFKIAVLAAVFAAHFPKQAEIAGFSDSAIEPQNLDFGVINGVPKDCLSFFYSFIGFVEISRSGRIEPLYFQIPFICKFLTEETREQLIMEVDRSSQHEKIESFLEMVLAADGEMRHQQALYRIPGLKYLSEGWQLYGWISFLLVIAVNLIILAATDKEDIMTGSDGWAEEAVKYINIAQIGMKALSYAFYLVEYYPNIIAKKAQHKSLEFTRYSSIRHNESIFMRASHKCTQKTLSPGWSKLRRLLTHPQISYFIFYTLFSVGCFWWRFLFPFLILDVLQHSAELGYVLRSITENGRQLLLLIVLWSIVLLVLADIGLFELSSYYQSTNSLFCSDMWDCFISTMHVGVRMGGGIGDMLTIVDIADERYLLRVAFDLLFFLIINVIHINISMGIVVDTFGQLRDERTKMMKDVNQCCFVCGCPRSEIERSGSGWSNHFLNEHSPFAYMALVKYLEAKAMNDCSGLEKYAKEKLLERDCVFFPTKVREGLIKKTSRSRARMRRLN